MSSSDYRLKARQVLSGAWGISILAALIATLLGASLIGGSIRFNIRSEDLQRLFGNSRAFLSFLLFSGSFAGFLGFAQFILGGTIKLGYCRFLLKQHDGGDPQIADLFSQFDRFGNGFFLALLQSIFILLWSLLLIIPGIVAAYSYSMAQFIMLENPEMRPMEALRASKQMMYGHKMDLFLLNLSFIGWSILCVFTLGIGLLWLNPYMNAAYAAFYRDISGSSRYGYAFVESN